MEATEEPSGACSGQGVKRDTTDYVISLCVNLAFWRRLELDLRALDGSGADVLRGSRLATGPSVWPPLPLPTGLSHFLSGAAGTLPHTQHSSLPGVRFIPGKRGAPVSSSQFTCHPQGKRLEKDVMVRIADRLELYISCILK